MKKVINAAQDSVNVAKSTEVKVINKTKSMNNITSKSMMITYHGYDLELFEWIDTLVQICNRVQEKSKTLSYEGLFLMNKTIKPLAELGSNNAHMIRRADYVILMSSTKAIIMEDLMKCLKNACGSLDEAFVISQCRISIPTSKQDLNDNVFADNMDTIGVLDSFADIEPNSKDPLSALFDILMECPASTKYIFKDYFTNLHHMLEASKLLASAAADNYKPAVQFLENLEQEVSIKKTQKYHV